MARARSRRQRAHPTPGSRASHPPQRAGQARQAGAAAPGRRPGSAGLPSRWLGWWQRRSTPVRLGLLAILVLAVLVGIEQWINRPPTPDASAVHTDIAAGRTGAEVTFTGILVSDPTDSGGHERMLVRDQLGDTLELDYNTTLGHAVPVHRGSAVTVHGQLYVDPGQAGVHCLHAQTSRGCPEPGWIQFAGSTYQ